MSPLCSVGSKCRAFGAFMADISEESEMGHPASNGSDVGPGDLGAGWMWDGFLKIHISIDTQNVVEERSAIFLSKTSLSGSQRVNQQVHI